jgi:surface protein
MGAISLTSLNLSNFDTSNVTEMSEMFYSTSSLATLDVSGWDLNLAGGSAEVFTDSNPGLIVTCDQDPSVGLDTFFGKACN